MLRLSLWWVYLDLRASHAAVADYRNVCLTAGGRPQTGFGVHDESRHSCLHRESLALYASAIARLTDVRARVCVCGWALDCHYNAKLDLHGSHLDLKTFISP